MLRRIVQERSYQECRRQADWDVDEEAPAPCVIVRDPSAERRPERRRDNDAEQEDGLHNSLLLAREDLPDRGLRSRQQCRTTCALQQTEEHELPKRVRGAAQE